MGVAKIGIGKITLHQTYDNFVDVCLNEYGFAILPIEPYHAAILTTLPYHHRDPFDRLLVAQALSEGIPIVSDDKGLDAYAVKRLW